MPDHGFDTASTITSSLANSAQSAFGTAAYWLRYLSPSPSANVINGNFSTAHSELQAVWDTGGRYLVPLCEPLQSRLSDSANGATYGTADATTFINAVIWLFNNVAPLNLPSGGQLNCFLAMEPSTTLRSSYWNAWAGYVNSYFFAGSFPFYACLYCSPNSDNGCTIVKTSGNAVCYGLWANHPQLCSYCTSFWPGWNPNNCGLTVWHWQYASPSGCSSCGHPFGPNVDLDDGHTDVGALNTAFHLSSRP